LFFIRSLPENSLIVVETYWGGKRRLLASQILSKFLVFMIYSRDGAMKSVCSRQENTTCARVHLF